MLDDIVRNRQVRVALGPMVLSVPHFMATGAESAGTEQSAGGDSTADVQMAQMEVDAARAEGQRLLQLAERQAQELLLNAQRQGFEAGQATGRAAAEGEAKAFMQLASHVLEQTKVWQHEMVNQSEVTIKTLVGQIAQQLFGHGFELPPEQIRVVVMRALEQAHGLGQARVKLNPQDAKALQGLGPIDFEIIADPDMEPGGCVVVAENGTVDGRVGTQLEELLKPF